MKNLSIEECAVWFGVSVPDIVAAIERKLFISDGKTVTVQKHTHLMRHAVLRGTPLSQLQPVRFRGRKVQTINNIAIRSFTAPDGRTRYQAVYPDNSTTEHNLLSEARQAARQDTRFITRSSTGTRGRSIHFSGDDQQKILDVLPNTAEYHHIRKKLSGSTLSERTIQPYKYKFMNISTGEMIEVNNLRNFASSVGIPPSTFVAQVRRSGISGQYILL